MGKSGANSKVRRQKVRQRKAVEGPAWLRLLRRIGWWPVAVALVFSAVAVVIALYGTQSLEFKEGEIIRQPIPAKVTFTVEDKAKTEQNKLAARANTPSHFSVDHEFVGRICGELTKLYQEARAADTVAAFLEIAKQATWLEAQKTYEYLHPRGDDAGAAAYKTYVEQLRRKLTTEYTAQPNADEGRDPPSNTGYIMVQYPNLPPAEGGPPGPPTRVNLVDVNQISNTKNMVGRAGVLARVFPSQMRATVEAVLTRALQHEPILDYSQADTLEAMKQAEAAAPPAITAYEKGKPYVFPGRYEQGRDKGLTAQDINLLTLHQEEYEAFLDTDNPKARKKREATYSNLQMLGLVSVEFDTFLAENEEEANDARNEEYLAQAGTAVLFVMIAVALFGYVGVSSRGSSRSAPARWGSRLSCWPCCLRCGCST